MLVFENRDSVQGGSPFGVCYGDIAFRLKEKRSISFSW